MSDSPDWRSRRWAATHQRIYEAAMALIHEHGYDNVSVGLIAAGADVSVPTFYAHYASKEHILMQLPTAEDMNALVAALPADLPLRERMKYAPHVWAATWTPEMRESTLERWRIIAEIPGLRVRAAEFERTTAGLIADALRREAGGTLSASDGVVVQVFMTAFTAAVLAWADCNGERKLEELFDDTFEAL